ncbi:PTS ascorbate transporter subunit IIC [Anoxybacterium hadale]|uniref:PTS ascorbate transporter subunit IIC n=1 Tax=Anoxybacterium hadale TaxID=3408580 RepID=A0ACD1AAG6_9FIRM|nr:PTS ascorbate transporter subunit IIC [Clostridiales bacterium]
MGVLNFIINEIFGQGAIFLAIVALIGLILQKKSTSEIVRGTLMTAIGFFVLSQGTGIIVTRAIDGLSGAFNTMMPTASGSPDIDMTVYGTQIGIVMLVAFAFNLFFARFTRWKSIFLTGHMLYWFPYVFIAAGVDAGLTGVKLVVLAAVFTSAYMVISPNLMRPLVKEVTGDDSFTIGHPTTILSVISGYLGKAIGNKSRSTEDLKIPKGLGFLREVSITGSIVICITYVVMYFILLSNKLNPGEVWGYAGGSTGAFTYIFTKSVFFGVGITIMLLGVRMLIAEIVPAFKGIAEKLVPGAIPALDCPVIFNYAPNALIIGFIVAMITSTITIIMTAGMFPTIIIPLTVTCFFEIGTAAIIGNATGGVRGAVVGAALSGIIMIFLVGFGSYFFGNTINNWMLVYGGQDFSFWGILEGLVARLIL